MLSRSKPEPIRSSGKSDLPVRDVDLILKATVGPWIDGALQLLYIVTAIHLVGEPSDVLAELGIDSVVIYMTPYFSARYISLTKSLSHDSGSVNELQGQTWPTSGSHLQDEQVHGSELEQTQLIQWFSSRRLVWQFMERTAPRAGDELLSDK